MTMVPPITIGNTYYLCMSVSTLFVVEHGKTTYINHVSNVPCGSKIRVLDKKPGSQYQFLVQTVDTMLPITFYTWVGSLMLGRYG